MTRNQWIIAAVAVIWTGCLGWLNYATTHKLQNSISLLKASDGKLQADNRKLKSENQTLNSEVMKLRDFLSQANLQIHSNKIEQQKLAEKLKVMVPAPATPLGPDWHPLSAKDMVALKKAFDDIQGEVAAGKFQQLPLMSAYQTMQKILDGPELAQLQTSEQTLSGAKR